MSGRRVGAPMRVALVFGACVACRGAHGAAADDVPVAAVAGAAPVPSAPGRAEDEQRTSRFDLAVSPRRACVRVESRVRCAGGLAALASAPAIAEDAIDLALGADFACIVRSAGVVSCWGANGAGQLGAGLAAPSSDAPVDVRGITRARRVAAGELHACALLDDGAVTCWGDDQMGATGGSVAYIESLHELVRPDRVGITASAIALGSNVSYAIVKGEIAVWGASPIDQVVNERPRTVGGIDGVDALAAYGMVVCDVRRGALACMGRSWSLFGDFRGHASDPIALHVHAPVRRVRIAERHGCALRVDGRVECWGSNADGALGRRDANDSSATYMPDLVEDLPRAIDVFVGESTSCALTDGRDLYCWGTISPTPIAVRL